MAKMHNDPVDDQGDLIPHQDGRILFVHHILLVFLRTTPKHRSGSRLQYLPFRLEMVLHHAQDRPMVLPEKEDRLQYRSRTLLRRHQSGGRVHGRWSSVRQRRNSFAVHLISSLASCRQSRKTDSMLLLQSITCKWFVHIISGLIVILLQGNCGSHCLP